MILLLTDKPVAGHRVAASLEGIGPVVILDLLDPEQANAQVERASVSMIVSDLSFGASNTIAALRRHLDGFGADRPPYLCLLREDTPRARAQATALRASRILDEREMSAGLPGVVSAMLPRKAEPVLGAAAGVANASAALARMFELGRSGAVIEPGLIRSTATFIDSAMREGSVGEWLELVWNFDDMTHQHCLLVAVIASGFGRQLGLGRTDCQSLTQAALLHDVGKCRVPLAILRKPGKLTVEERGIIDTHPSAGHAMLLPHGYSAQTLAVVRSHHEYLDGSGYPDGLSGQEIPDLVRLVTICDIFSALIERRAYKAPMSGENAIGILESMSGKLDADLLRAFRPLALAASRAVYDAAQARARLQPAVRRTA